MKDDDDKDSEDDDNEENDEDEDDEDHPEDDEVSEFFQCFMECFENSQINMMDFRVN